jgi:CubicO group peptidase (beta-lactamase class C family)
MLLEEGYLRLTDPIARYLPAFADVKVLDSTGGLGVRLVAPARPITIRDLLTHTAGLSYGFDENVQLDDLYRAHVWGPMETNPALTLREFVDAVAKMPLAFSPGTQFRYSVAIDVLGYLVEVISGIPFDKYLQQRIFEPLGMKDTSFWVTAEKQTRLAATYGPSETGPRTRLDGPQINSYLHPVYCPFGGAGLVSTIEDYLRFAQMLLNKGALGEERLLSRKTVELMTTNHLPDGIRCFDNPAEGFGLGGSIITDLGKSQLLGSVGNFGWGGAANTNFWIDPKEELLGILMLQYMPSDTWPVVTDFRNLTYQALVD